jgi:hypothetical protein
MRLMRFVLYQNCELSAVVVMVLQHGAPTLLQKEEGPLQFCRSEPETILQGVQKRI